MGLAGLGLGELRLEDLGTQQRWDSGARLEVSRFLWSNIL